MLVEGGAETEGISTVFAAERLFQRVNVPHVVLQAGRLTKGLLADRTSVSLDSSVSVLVAMVR